jgi:crossover junction endodeoxyribonuclease RusA
MRPVMATRAGRKGCGVADMETTGIPFPFELVVAETPLSLQAAPRSLQRWKKTLRDVAKLELCAKREQWFIDERPLSMKIFYFRPVGAGGDLDNIIKSILNAFKTVLYQDDSVIERIVAQRFDPDVIYAFEDVSAKLAEALEGPPPMLYPSVDDDETWRRAK